MEPLTYQRFFDILPPSTCPNKEVNMSNVRDDIEVLSTLDVYHPQYETRTGEVRMRGHKPQRFTAKLRVLVPHSVYLIEEIPEGIQGWKTGQVLIRNLELTERVKGKDVAYDDQVFVRYDNVFDAFRATSRLNPRYRSDEIPNMDAWLEDSNRLTELAWELKPTTDEVGVRYQLIAHGIVSKHGNVRNAHKTHALKKTYSAMRMKDVRGRFNVGRLPLMHLSIDVALWNRIRESRGIGHRMDFRAAVLELFIAKLVDASNTAQRDLKHLLRADGLFNRKRKPSEVLRAAETLEASSAMIKFLMFRPFSRVFTHVVKDLDEAVQLMRTAVGPRDPIQLGYAKVALNRAYRSLEMLNGLFLMQEVLAMVASHVHRHKEMDVEAVETVCRSIRSIAFYMKPVDMFTREPFELNFRLPILERVKKYLDQVMDQTTVEKGRTKNIYGLLKLAVAPF